MAAKSLSVLLLLAVAALATLEKRNTGMRVDSLQDPTIDVILDGGPASILFESCVSKSLTLTARFYSIESAAGLIYNRYVPPKTYHVIFATAGSTTSMNNIIDCADYAGSVGASMFMYDGSKCQYVNNTVYDTTVPEDCGSAAKQAVFVQEPYTAPCGPLPSFSYVNGTVKACYGALSTLSIYWKSGCPDNIYSYTNEYTTYHQIKQLLTQVEWTSDLFFEYPGGTYWKFYDNINMTAEDFVDGSLPTVPVMVTGSGDYILYMSAADDFKLKVGPKDTTMAAMLCENPCNIC